jgi:Uma2 family endonuclease
MIINHDPRSNLPSAKDLPDSDDTPVDNELQDLIPHLLKDTLALIWSDKMDWFFGIDMGIYYHPEQPAIVPDGFISVGVPRIIDEDLRLSYLLWEERKVPILILEVVSHKRRREYTDKKQFYQEMGVLYYVVYNPLRQRKPRLEVYRLENGEYKNLAGEPFWLSELGLGIGRDRGSYQGIDREWLYWYDEQGDRYLTPAERLQQAEILRQQATEVGKLQGKLEAIPRLRSLGLTDEQIANALEIEIDRVTKILGE